jgi:hypothetical protein
MSRTAALTKEATVRELGRRLSGPDRASPGVPAPLGEARATEVCHGTEQLHLDRLFYALLREFTPPGATALSVRAPQFGVRRQKPEAHP